MVEVVDEVIARARKKLLYNGCRGFENKALYSFPPIPHLYWVAFSSVVSHSQDCVLRDINLQLVWFVSLCFVFSSMGRCKV